MDRLVIICVDDQPEVLNAVARDLAPLADYCDIEECQSADECLELMDEMDAQGAHLALLISDHVMPKVTGVELLTQVKEDSRFEKTHKFLLTGLATHQDTIQAINQAGIEHYFEKAWEPEQLLAACRKALTHYVFEAGLDHQEYLPVLDAETTYHLLSK